jgi:hypothetical protein
VLLGSAENEPVYLLAVDDVARAETRLGLAAWFLAAHNARTVLRPGQRAASRYRM